MSIMIAEIKKLLLMNFQINKKIILALIIALMALILAMVLKMAGQIKVQYQSGPDLQKIQILIKMELNF